MRLHIKCGLLDTGNLIMLHINWLNHCEVPYINVDIVQNFYNAYSTPKSLFVEKYSDSWDPKIHGPRNYLQIFMWPLSLINAGPQSIVYLQCFKMVSQKIQYHLLQARWTMEFLCHPLILQWHPRKRKISMPRLKSKWRTLFISYNKRLCTV